MAKSWEVPSADQDVKEGVVVLLQEDFPGTGVRLRSGRLVIVTPNGDLASLLRASVVYS